MGLLLLPISTIVLSVTNTFRLSGMTVTTSEVAINFDCTSPSICKKVYKTVQLPHMPPTTSVPGQRSRCSCTTDIAAGEGSRLYWSVKDTESQSPLEAVNGTAETTRLPDTYSVTADAEGYTTTDRSVTVTLVVLTALVLIAFGRLARVNQ